MEKPNGAYDKDGKTYDAHGQLIEVYEDQWRVVKDGSRFGWWRFNEHYDRDGYMRGFNEGCERMMAMHRENKS